MRIGRFTKTPPLVEATVAIVTTAGLHRQGQDGWKRGDESFRILEASDRNLIMSHLSPNFDRAGFAIDVNVVFPTDRLRELAGEGIIKAAAPRNLSFMGAAGETLATIRLDSGPAAAKVLPRRRRRRRFANRCLTGLHAYRWYARACFRTGRNSDGTTLFHSRPHGTLASTAGAVLSVSFRTSFREAE